VDGNGRYLTCTFLPAALICLAAAFTGCGQAGPPPLTGDFSASVSPDSASVVVGNSSPIILVSITPQNGFTGTVSISLQGVPEGVSVIPAASFSVDAGGSQSVTFVVTGSAPVGPSSITFLASSGRLSHRTQFSLTAEAMVSTYQIGSLLYLESGTTTDTARMGLETNWGGTIVEASLNGTNFVNEHDTGREVQPSYRDGNNQNYNPTPGGDIFDQGTPIISYSITADSLYTKSRPLQWDPASYGGGLGKPVAGDILFEQTVTAVASELHTFKVHIKATHLGNDLHANSGQEFPAVYTNQEYGRFLYYAGNSPWTNGVATAIQFPILGQPNPPIYVSERWGALVNMQNQGLTVYIPSVDPYFIGFVSPDAGGGGPTDNYTNYFAPLGNLTIGPGFVFEGEFYVIAGDLTLARQTIYRLHQSLSIPDIFSPFETTDQPAAGSKLSGATPVSGWAVDDVKVSRVEILIDGAVDGTAHYGDPRPDVAAAIPFSPVDVGFSYSLDTTKYKNGPHTLSVRVTDTSDNLAVTPDLPIVVSN
jgi:Bacterial Ig domain